MIFDQVKFLGTNISSLQIMWVFIARLIISLETYNVYKTLHHHPKS
jgi:hypothetical protein